MTEDEIIIYTDGGARGNPGPAGFGYVLLRPNESIIAGVGEYLGEMTNNQAEYRAIIAALSHAQQYNPKRVTCYMDSELIVNQLNGNYRVKHPELKPLHERARALADVLPHTSFTHVRRERNKLADKLVNQAIDAQKTVTMQIV